MRDLFSKPFTFSGSQIMKEKNYSQNNGTLQGCQNLYNCAIVATSFSVINALKFTHTLENIFIPQPVVIYEL